jgi:hypothetical protein
MRTVHFIERPDDISIGVAPRLQVLDDICCGIQAEELMA